MSVADVFEKVRDACCTVVIDGGSGVCSGGFVKNSLNIPGIFVTCSHCVVTLISSQAVNTANPAPLFNLLQIAVKNMNGVQGDHRLVPAQLLGYCAQADVAVLYVNQITHDHPVLEFESEPSQLRTGDQVIVIGNPAGRDDTSCSPGWVRDVNFELEAFRTTDVYINAPTTFGSSGSPVLNTQGKMVSILSWGPASPSGDAVTTEGGGARSIFIQIVVESFASFFKIGTHPRIDLNRRYLVPFIGLQGLTTDSFNVAAHNIVKMQGYIITDVAKNSPFFAVFGQGNPVILLSADGFALGPHADQKKLADILFFKKRNDTMEVEWRYVTDDISLPPRKNIITLTTYVSSQIDEYQVLKGRTQSQLQLKNTNVKVTKSSFRLK